MGGREEDGRLGGREEGGKVGVQEAHRGVVCVAACLVPPEIAFYYN